MVSKGNKVDVHHALTFVELAWKGRCGHCMIDAGTAATNSQWVFQTSVDVTLLLLLLI
jgi:hypothetical protein